MSITANMAWPPKVLAPLLARAAESQVWWEGDTVALDAFYRRGTITSGRAGRVRKAWNAFWGREQANPTAPPKKLHVPIAADITKLSASELFSSPLTIMAADTDQDTEGVQATVDALFNSPDFHSRLHESAVRSSALGGVYGRVVWDDTIGQAWVDFVDVDNALPEWRWGRLHSVTFWTELDSLDGRTIYRHLERHESGRIIHQLFTGTPDNLGRIVDLTAHPATADIALDGPDYTSTGIDAMTAAYIPNDSVDPAWRGDPMLKHMGRPDLSTDVIPLMDQLDEVYSSLMRDYRIGKARMFASESTLQSLGVGQGVRLSDDQEIFTRVGNSVGKDGDLESLFQFHQPSIRVAEHAQGAEMLVREILRRTGYSPISFGMPDDVAQTATEATGKAKLTLSTTLAKSRHYTAGLVALLTAATRIHAARYGGVAPSEPLEIEWPQFARESELSKAQTVQAWSVASAASTRTKVAYLHSDWDEGRVDAEVELIDGANAITVPDFTGGFGGDQSPLPANEPPADGGE